MSVHAFGGAWTERKLSVVRRYLEMYAQALKNQAFQRVYIDAFAGTGDRTDRRREAVPLLDVPEFEAVAKGSTRPALEVEPPFHRYVFIERVTRRASELTALKSEFPARQIEIVNDDANGAIAALCKGTDWRGTRGVVFLDPYGLQVTWDTRRRPGGAALGAGGRHCDRALAAAVGAELVTARPVSPRISPARCGPLRFGRPRGI